MRWAGRLKTFQAKRSLENLMILEHYWQSYCSWLVLWRSLHPLELASKKKKKRCPYHHRGLEWKSRKSTDIQNNRQLWLLSTKWSKSKANRVLSKEYTDHSKHLFQQAKRWLYTRTSSDWLCSLQPKMEKLYPVSKNKTWRLTVAQTMSSSLQNSCLNWKKK